jgi:hypothetical protein
MEYNFAHVSLRGRVIPQRYFSTRCSMFESEKPSLKVRVRVIGLGSGSGAFGFGIESPETTATEDNIWILYWIGGANA